MIKVELKSFKVTKADNCLMTFRLFYFYNLSTHYSENDLSTEGDILLLL